MATLRYPAATLTVLVDGTPHSDLDVVSIHESVGGAQPNEAVIRLRTNRPAAPGWPGNDTPIVDYTFYLALEGRLIAIVDTLGKVRHRGAVRFARVIVDPYHGEWVELRSSWQGFLMGGTLDGMETINQPDGEDEGGVFAIQEAIVFNPLVDGKVVFNRAHEPSKRIEGHEYPCFVDPESVRTGFAREENNAGEDNFAEEWTLAEAIVYILGRCAFAEIENPALTLPTVEEIEGQLGDFAPKLQNVELPLGLFADQALDQLLRRFGVAWHLEHESPTESRLKVWPYLVTDAAEEPVSLRLQAPFQALDLEQTDVVSLDLSYDQGDLANVAVIITAPLEIEGTWPLIPAWDEAYDNESLANLLSSDPETGARNAMWDDDPELRIAWRKWVLNEAGDYTGLRTGPWFDHPFDLQAAAAEIVPLVAEEEQDVAIYRRKRFLPTLARNDEGGAAGLHTGGVTVEWYNAVESAWCLIDTVLEETGGRVELLPDEAGIYLSGIDPPIEIQSQYNPQQSGAGQSRGLGQALRITATLQCDRGLRVVLDRTTQSASPWWIETLVDGSRRWPMRVVAESGDYQSIYSEYPSLAIEDLEAYYEEILQDAELLLEQANLATLQGTVPVWGFEWDRYPLSTPIDKVEGRNITLDGRRGGGGFPRVMGQTFYPHQQVTLIHLASLKSQYAPARGNWAEKAKVGKRVKYARRSPGQDEFGGGDGKIPFNEQQASQLMLNTAIAVGFGAHQNINPATFLAAAQNQRDAEMKGLAYDAAMGSKGANERLKGMEAQPEIDLTLEPGHHRQRQQGPDRGLQFADGERPLEYDAQGNKIPVYGPPPPPPAGRQAPQTLADFMPPGGPKGEEHPAPPPPTSEEELLSEQSERLRRMAQSQVEPDEIGRMFP